MDSGRAASGPYAPIDASQSEARLCWRSEATPQRRASSGWRNASSTTALRGFSPHAKAHKTRECGG
ncbi:MAG: hypothetical protein N0C81_05580 [Candidatus Thiodiazotropha lotti]|nr:hypothetical protein [Candidatus Thiodiazotropha lotti]MCG8002759.1 hypothetical protein [Candidatus Thiodiazotropha lotti]MCG8007104.1 hypothetical protein [Candidatus Thiodiazotropha lotti]MCW4186379.1 hypothetical protein [Candidatus Thiodiazotropha lotti]MCW4194685.1 hypothetical protein [Candidatus Thiodiazotropha lotti]